MDLPQMGTLETLPAREHPDLLGPTVARALASWDHASEVAVVEIDPTLADTAAMTEAYEELYEAMLAGYLSGTRGRRPLQDVG